LLPHGVRSLPKPPNAPPCWKCASLNYSSEKCRVKLDHVDPSSAYSSTELEDFFHSVEVLTSNHRQYSIDALNDNNSRMDKREKDRGKGWDKEEEFSLLVALYLVQSKDSCSISELLNDKTAKQVTTYLSSAPPATLSLFSSALAGQLPTAPAGYVPPPQLAILMNSVSFEQPTNSGGNSGGIGGGSSNSNKNKNKMHINGRNKEKDKSHLNPFYEMEIMKGMTANEIDNYRYNKGLVVDSASCNLSLVAPKNSGSWSELMSLAAANHLQLLSGHHHPGLSGKLGLGLGLAAIRPSSPWSIR
jgi:hypothetical protein